MKHSGVSVSAVTPWRWAVAGVLLGLMLTVMVYAPASWLAFWVKQASGGQVLLQETKGTLWAGSARLTLTGGAGSLDASTLPSRLTWDISPTLTGVRVRWRANCCMQQDALINLMPRWGGWQMVLSDSPSQWPAQWLSGLGTPWNTLQVQGDFNLTTQGMTLTWLSGRMQVAGQAQLDALDMASHLSTLRPMGSYRLILTGGSSPALSLSTIRGSLQLSGSGQWVGGKLRFNGEASAVPEHQAALDNLLNIIGRRNGARSIIKVG